VTYCKQSITQNHWLKL